MILERAELLVKQGMEAEFAQVLRDRGIHLLSQGEGCSRVEVGQGVENPAKFILLLEWERVEQHVAYIDTPAHKEFSELFAPFAAGGAMEHFEIL